MGIAFYAGFAKLLLALLALFVKYYLYLKSSLCLSTLKKEAKISKIIAMSLTLYVIKVFCRIDKHKSIKLWIVIIITKVSMCEGSNLQKENIHTSNYK